MRYETISLTHSDGLAVLTLNRPDTLNGLNTQMRAEVMHAVTHAPEQARAVVLTGAGRAFCSGQDLGSDVDVADIDLERTLRDEYTPLIRAIVDCPIPTLAAVNGPAAGAGANLALACDVTIATESAYFMQAFSRIGLIPDAGGTYVMPRTIGMAKAMGAALFADKITARQADQWGLIWEAVADDAFDGHWRARAAHLAAGPTQAYTAIKKSIRASWQNGLEDQLVMEAEEQGACGHSRDFKEGVLAFLQKRPAKFEGR